MADKMARPTLLMTRPQLASRRFLQRLEDDGMDVADAVISPAIDIKPVGEPVALTGVAGVIFTSVNGVGRAQAVPGLPAWCVGDQTAWAAAQAGFEARSAGGNAADLVALILGSGGQGPLIHIRGVHSRGDVAEALRAAGIAVNSVISYDQPAQDPTDDAAALFQAKGRVLAPLFSPRSAGVLRGWAQGAEAPIEAVALSEAVAEAWGQPVTVARHPDGAAMVDAIRAALMRG
ncbi:MAG: uroporphyrinogen-III synthase [Pseudomonadota bacterium]